MHFYPITEMGNSKFIPHTSNVWFCITESCSGVQCPAGTWCARGACSCNTPCGEAAREPVCSATGQTFPHECALLKAACEARMRGDAPLRVAYYGECTDSPYENSTTGNFNLSDLNYLFKSGHKTGSSCRLRFYSNKLI